MLESSVMQKMWSEPYTNRVEFALIPVSFNIGEIKKKQRPRGFLKKRKEYIDTLRY